MKKQLHPLQPVERDERGVIRFRKNNLVCWLLEHSGISLNTIALRGFTVEDQEQFAQLLGSSVCHFGDGDHNPETIEMAHRLTAGLFAAGPLGPTSNSEGDDGRWRDGFAAGRARALEEIRDELRDVIQEKIQRGAR